ncbi:hypothetical protein ES703_55048 [subsurface metagenome]
MPASAATSAESAGVDKFTIPNGRTTVGVEVYRSSKAAAARRTMTAGSGIVLVSVYTIKAIPSLGRAVSDNAIRDKGAALTETGYCPSEGIVVIALKRVEVQDGVAVTIYNSEAANDCVGGFFAAAEDKSTPKSQTIDNCVSNTAGVVRTFACDKN